MSASVTATVSVTGTIGSGNGVTIGLRPPTVTSIPAADPAIESVQNIGTSAEAIGVGDIGTGGMFCCWNMDNTNFVVLSMANDASTPFAKLLAGESACFPVANKAIYAKADTAPINLAYCMLSR